MLSVLMMLIPGFFSEATASTNECESEMIRAAKENDIPLPVLYAVALTETGQRGELKVYAMNIHGRSVISATLDEALSTFEAARREGTKLIDIGCMQVNHYYHGRHFSDVRDMFDPHKNVSYAARFLKALHNQEGRWTEAVARYHAGSGNPSAQRRYVCAVIHNMMESGFGAWTPEAAQFCGR